MPDFAGSVTTVLASVSESFKGVAAPLSLDTHSSSSPSEGLEIVNPTFCLDPWVLLELVKACGAPRWPLCSCSLECTRARLLGLGTGDVVRECVYRQFMSQIIQIKKESIGKMKQKKTYLVMKVTIPLRLFISISWCSRFLLCQLKTKSCFS